MPAKSVPDGWHSITPRLVVHEPEKLVGFLKRVLKATGDYNENRPSEIRIGDSIVMVGGVAGAMPSNPAYLYLYIEDL